MNKSASIIEAVQKNGFMHYFFIHFTNVMQEFDQKIQCLFEITRIEHKDRWDFSHHNKINFTTKDGSTIVLSNDNKHSFLDDFADLYCEVIHLKNIQKFINICKDEFKNFWIIDRNHQMIYLRFRNVCGEGAVKKTYLGWNVTHNKPIVVYQINVSMNNTEQKRCLNEKRIAELEKSPYLLTIYYSVANKETRKIFMIANYYKYDVQSMIYHHHKRWSLEELRRFSRNILNGMKVLHDMNIIHRDIKPSNIIYDDNQDLYMLIDFGVATKFTSGIHLNKIETVNGNCNQSHLSLVGTPGYISPEMYASLYSLKKIQYNCKVDIFSFGITLLEMFLGKRAFLDDFKSMGSNIKKDLTLKQKEFEKILLDNSLFLQSINKKLDHGPTKKIETLRNEIQEKIDIIHQINACDHDDKEMYINELIDKNKTINHCCQKLSCSDLKELDLHTCDEYEFLSKMKTLQSFAKKIDENWNETNKEENIVNECQNYPLLFMMSSYEYPQSISQVEDEQFADFLQKCLHKNPDFRSTTEDLLLHPWLTT